MFAKRIVIASAVLLAGCASPSQMAKNTAGFLLVAATQDQFVESCVVERNSSLECQAEFEATRRGHRDHYASLQREQHEISAAQLSNELDAYLAKLESEPSAD